MSSIYGCYKPAFVTPFDCARTIPENQRRLYNPGQTAFCFLAPESWLIPDLKTPDTDRLPSTTPILTWKTRRPKGGEEKKVPS